MDWLSNKKVVNDYVQCCKEAVENDNVFKRFKQDPRYFPILEHVSWELGMAYYNELSDRFKKNLGFFSKFNDSVGGPICMDVNGLSVSPTTIRYVNVLNNIDKWINMSLVGAHIVEIGGGYGGQALIIDKFTEIGSYYIHDIPEVMALQRKYLGLFGIELYCHPDTPIDLVISNYAWSELSQELRKKYLDEVISKARHGYITINGGSEVNTSFMIGEIITNIRKDVKVFADLDKKHPHNRVVVW